MFGLQIGDEWQPAASDSQCDPDRLGQRARKVRGSSVDRNDPVHFVDERRNVHEVLDDAFRIVAGPQTVAFLVNGTEVASLPRAQVSPDGVYGLRFNHAVNAHVVKVAKGK